VSQRRRAPTHHSLHPRGQLDAARVECSKGSGSGKMSETELDRVRRLSLALPEATEQEA